ncbi:hypothetical protein ACED96_01560 [Clostridium thermobutyricum]|uniref:Uncharacterized protein n=2 Tax=Clostridium thermobutyricum TaxID=29372 RepID=N9WH75_9CLOT|nr:hypothetical protein [Clostridium thermobutyricum]ENZ02185.1 hypothetical protein HMPREF1092_01420 [Clostridium thermobutyricum]OPX45270.1 hypothetical protein CLTHE_30340 [Clostridium thermobutyricum DSM 4928]
MGRRNKGFGGNFSKSFVNIRRNFGNCGCFRWFTPVRCCICVGIFLMLLLSGVGFYPMIIIGLLIVLMQLVC